MAALVEAATTSSVPSVTADERRLADALCNEPPGSESQATPESDTAAFAELLRLAEGVQTERAFVVGLRQAFLIPDDSWHPPAREDRATTFADVYSRLALAGLPGDARGHAQAILHELTTPR